MRASRSRATSAGISPRWTASCSADSVWERRSVGARSSCSSGDLDSRARQVEDGAGVDDEPGHRAPPIGCRTPRHYRVSRPTERPPSAQTATRPALDKHAHPSARQAETRPSVPALREGRARRHLPLQGKGEEAPWRRRRVTLACCRNVTLGRGSLPRGDGAFADRVTGRRPGSFASGAEAVAPPSPAHHVLPPSRSCARSAPVAMGRAREVPLGCCLTRSLLFVSPVPTAAMLRRAEGAAPAGPGHRAVPPPPRPPPSPWGRQGSPGVTRPHRLRRALPLQHPLQRGPGQQQALAAGVLELDHRLGVVALTGHRDHPADPP